MTSDVKSNKWVSHIKKYASENGISYREAMRDEGCKTAYKTPVSLVERSPSPVRTPSPEPVETKKRSKKMLVKLEPLPVPELVRSEPVSVPVSEPELLIPTVIKKERVKRSPKMVPT